MGLLVDVRKYNLDNFINDLIDSSLITKKWWGKQIDNYWEYLGKICQPINFDLNAHIISDLFVYFIDNLGFVETLNKYSKILSQNRSSYVTILIIYDKEYLLDKISISSFINDFEMFCKNLNGEIYEYDTNSISANIQYFKSILDEIDNDTGLIINIG